VNASAAESERFEQALELLGPMLTAESLEDAAAHATRLFASLSEAEAVALFLVSGKDTGGEFWVPADVATRLRFRPHLRGLALEFLVQGVPVATPFPPEVSSGLEPAVLPLLDRGRTLGVVCFAGRADKAARCASAAVVVARQMAQHQEKVQSQASRARYERWFRQFDSQMRLLERERQKFAAIVSQSDTYVFTADPARTVRWVSRAMATRFSENGGPSWVGRTCDEVWARLGQPAGAAVSTACPVSQALATGRPAHQEFRPDQGARTRAFYVTALPIREPEGRIQEVLVVAQDLSGLELVRRMEQGLQVVVGNAPVVLFAVDREGIFRLSEGRGLARLGLRPGQVVGLSAFEFYRDHPQIVESLRRALAGEDFVAEVQVGELSYETHYSPQRDEAGEVIGVVGVATDVSERSRLAARLRDSQQMNALGRLAASVATDFSELLTVIMGNAELMLGRLKKEHPLRHLAEEVRRAGTQGAQLVRQLQMLIRRESATPQPLDPDVLLAGMESLLRRLTGDDVELVIAPGPRAARVSADRGQLEQALMNLVLHARDALPRGGRVVIERGEVEIEAGCGGRHDLPPGSYVTLTVSRAGPELDDAAQSRIEPSRDVLGDGHEVALGLPLAHDIVRRCGGDMIARSGPETDAAITIRLPRLDGTSAQAEDATLREAA
jgi:PAS domain S-box-containing protein